MLTSVEVTALVQTPYTISSNILNPAVYLLLTNCCEKLFFLIAVRSSTPVLIARTRTNAILNGPVFASRPETVKANMEDRNGEEMNSKTASPPCKRNTSRRHQ